MKTLHLTLTVILVSLLAACGLKGIPGNGIMIEEVREIEAFSELSLAGSYSVKVIIGEEPSLKIKGEENLLPLIRTMNSGEELIIEPTQKISPTKGMELHITTPKLVAISTSGASSIEAGPITAEKFEASLVGSDTLYVVGEADELELSLSGAGKIHANELKARKVSISVTGAGTADVYASESLEAGVTGVGTIDYYGNPKDVNTSITGIGAINRQEQ